MIRNGEDDAGKLMAQVEVSVFSVFGSGGAWGSVAFEWSTAVVGVRCSVADGRPRWC